MQNATAFSGGQHHHTYHAFDQPDHVFVGGAGSHGNDRACCRVMKVKGVGSTGFSWVGDGRGKEYGTVIGKGTVTNYSLITMATVALSSGGVPTRFNVQQIQLR